MTKGHELLITWTSVEEVGAAELAERLQRAARRMRGIRAPKRPPVKSVRMWLMCEWTPQYSWRAVLDKVTGGEVYGESWTEAA